MRKLVVALFIALAVVAGYVLREVPMQAQVVQADWVPFTTGEVVTLSVDLPEGTIRCTVTEVQHGFIGCRRENRLDSWYNLRFVKGIHKRER